MAGATHSGSRAPPFDARDISPVPSCSQFGGEGTGDDAGAAFGDVPPDDSDGSGRMPRQSNLLGGAAGTTSEGMSSLDLPRRASRGTALRPKSAARFAPPRQQEVLTPQALLLRKVQALEAVSNRMSLLLRDELETVRGTAKEVVRGLVVPAGRLLA